MRGNWRRRPERFAREGNITTNTVATKRGVSDNNSRQRHRNMERTHVSGRSRRHVRRSDERTTPAVRRRYALLHRQGYVSVLDAHPSSSMAPINNEGDKVTMATFYHRDDSPPHPDPCPQPSLCCSGSLVVRMPLFDCTACPSLTVAAAASPPPQAASPSCFSRPRRRRRCAFRTRSLPRR